MSEQERVKNISDWWEGGFPGAFAADRSRDPIEPKVYAAFRRVLLAMPDEDFDQFIVLNPTIVCQPGVDGTVIQYYLPVWPAGAENVWLHVLYFRPDLHKLTEEGLVRLVAHEVAHLVLGHAGCGAVGHGEIHDEEAAERKAESWGFKGAYSMTHRRRLAAQHKRDRERLRQ